MSKIISPFAIGSSAFTKDTRYNATLYVPIGIKEAYKAKGGWKEFTFIEKGAPTGIKKINMNRNVNNTDKIDWYPHDGKQLTTPQQSVNIQRCGNEKTKKIIVKQ